MSVDYEFVKQNRKATYYDESIKKVQRQNEGQALNEIKAEDSKCQGLSKGT